MQRDFVIQIRSDADVNAGQFEGRVEHIASGRAAHFTTAEELVKFVAGAIAAVTIPAEDLTAL